MQSPRREGVRQLSSEPSWSEVPIPLHGGKRDLERLRGIGFAQATVKAQLECLRGAWVERFEALQGLSERQQPDINATLTQFQRDSLANATSPPAAI